MKTPTLQQKIQWAIRWWAIGDALWLAVEKKTKAEITENFWDIREYIPVERNEFIAKDIQAGKKLLFNPQETGIISDDTIFTMAWMNSISAKNNIALQHLFDAHKILFDKYGDTFFGWMTKERFKKYTVWWDRNILYNKSWSNGMLMKQFPYAAYFSALKKEAEKKWINPDELGWSIDNTIWEITATTHDTKIAHLVSVLHNKTLMYLLDSTPENFDARRLLEHLYSIAPIWERMLWINENDPSYDLDADMRISPILEKLLTQQSSIDAGLPYTYDQIIDTYIVRLDEAKDPNINKKMKPWFHVASTFGLVYACFLQNQNFQWVVDAIQIWYDTDSQGAVIGNMIGALHWPFYDQKYIDWLKDKKDIQQSLKKFQYTLWKKVNTWDMWKLLKNYIKYGI